MGGANVLPVSLGGGETKNWVVFRIITLDPKFPVSASPTPTSNPNGDNYERIDSNHIKMWSNYSGGASYTISVRPDSSSGASLSSYGYKFFVNSSGTAGHKLRGFLGSNAFAPRPDYNVVYWDDLQPDDDTWDWG